METITLIIGIVGFIGILLYLFQVLRSDAQNNTAVDLLRLILLLAAIGTLILIPKATIDDQYVCEPVMNFSAVEEVYKYGNNYSGYHWDYGSVPPQVTEVNVFHVYRNTTYTYDEHCYIKNGTTPAIFTGAVNWIYYILMTYLIGYLGWKSLLWLFESFGWRMKRENDNEE